MDEISEESDDLPVPSIYWNQESFPTFRQGNWRHPTTYDDDNSVITKSDNFNSSNIKISDSKNSKPFTALTRVLKKHKVSHKGSIEYSDSDGSDVERETDYRSNKKCLLWLGTNTLPELQITATESEADPGKCTNGGKHLENQKFNESMLVHTRSIKNSSEFEDEGHLNSGDSLTGAQLLSLRRAEQFQICQNFRSGALVGSDKPDLLGIYKSEFEKKQPHRLAAPCGVAPCAIAGQLANERTCEAHKSTDTRACHRSVMKNLEKTDVLSTAETSAKKNVEPMNTTLLDSRLSNSSEMEQSFYASGRLKISRSCFGAFRRRNYKFAPIIFSRGFECGSKAQMDKMKTAIRSNKNTAKGLDDLSTTTMKCDHKVAAKCLGTEDPVETTAIVLADTSQRGKMKDVISIVADSGKEISGGNNRGSVILPHETENKVQGSVVPTNSPRMIRNAAKNLILSNASCISSGKSSRSCSDFDMSKNTEKKSYSTVAEIFFADERVKVKPAPKRRTAVANPCKEEMSLAHKVTLLDDDDLWSSPKKSRIL